MEELLAWCGQPLREHLRNAALLAKGDPEALRRVAKKAREMGVELNERLLRREVETAVKKLAELTGDGNVARRVSPRRGEGRFYIPAPPEERRPPLQRVSEGT